MAAHQAHIITSSEASYQKWLTEEMVSTIDPQLRDIIPQELNPSFLPTPATPVITDSPRRSISFNSTDQSFNTSSVQASPNNTQISRNSDPLFGSQIGMPSTERDRPNQSLRMETQNLPEQPLKPTWLQQRFDQC